MKLCFAIIVNSKIILLLNVAEYPDLSQLGLQPHWLSIRRYSLQFCGIIITVCNWKHSKHNMCSSHNVFFFCIWWILLLASICSRYSCTCTFPSPQVLQLPQGILFIILFGFLCFFFCSLVSCTLPVHNDFENLFGNPLMAAVSAVQLNVGTAWGSVKSVNVHAEHNNLVSCCSCLLISQGSNYQKFVTKLSNIHQKHFSCG